MSSNSNSPSKVATTAQTFPTTWKDWKPLITRSGSFSPEMSRAFQAFVEANPDAVKKHNTTLHWIVSRNPSVNLVKTVLFKDPQVLFRREDFMIQLQHYRLTPLGVACRTNASEKVIRSLIRTRVVLHKSSQSTTSATQAAGQKRRREASSNVPYFPFQTTGVDEPSTFSPNHFRVLLEECPEGATMPHSPTEQPLLETILRCDVKTGNYWDNVNLAMKVASFGDVNDTREFVFLHAFLQLMCCAGPFQGRERDYSIDFCINFLNYIKSQAPEQFFMRNYNGDYPLHIAMQQAAATFGGWARQYTARLWEFLLTEYPESAGIADSHGRLALHLAIADNIPCMDALLEAEPRAVTTRDQTTHFYPFELVAVCSNNHDTESLYTEQESVNLSYRLLRMAPHVARTSVREPWVDTPEYKEYLRNKLKMAQIELETKLKIQDIEERNSELKREFKKR